MMATITIVDKTSGEIISVHNNMQPGSYDTATKTVRIPAGRGNTNISYGADVIMRVERDEGEPELEEAAEDKVERLEAELEESNEAFEILTGGIDYE